MKRMGRVRLTDVCNKKCPYCFAKDWLDKNPVNISLEEYSLVLEYLIKEGADTVAWQGGEPLIHPQIEDIIRITKEKGLKVVIFSNGVFKPEIRDALMEITTCILVNYNHPSTYSDKAWETVNENIAYMKDVVRIGYNLYEKEPDYKFILDAVDKFGINVVRFDLVRPSPGGPVNISFEEQKEYSPTILKFMEDVIAHGAKPEQDCTLPPCSFSEEEFEFIKKYGWKKLCSAEVDISGGLVISSCFCSFTAEGLKLTDFESYEEARSFLQKEEDYYRWQVPSHESCLDCSYYIQKMCQGGCIGYSLQKEPKVLNKKDVEIFRRFKKIENLFNEKQYDKVISYFNDYLKYKDNDYQAYNYCGMSYFLSGELEKAEKYLEKAYQLYPNNLSLVKSLALVKNVLGKDDEEENLLNWIEKYFPEDELSLK